MLHTGHDYVTIIPFGIYMLCPKTLFIGEVLVLVYSLLGKWKLLSCIQPFATPYTVPGILQARILEWVAGPFSRGSSQPTDWTQVSHSAGRFFTNWATREAPLLGRYSFQTGWVCVCVCVCVCACACACACMHLQPCVHVVCTCSASWFQFVLFCFRNFYPFSYTHTAAYAIMWFWSLRTLKMISFYKWENRESEMFPNIT